MIFGRHKNQVDDVMAQAHHRVLHLRPFDVPGVGYKAVVPVDGMSAEDPYNEQYAAWHLYKGGPVNLTGNVTLTRSDLIRFAN
jgi:hypothetical protein